MKNKPEAAQPAFAVPLTSFVEPRIEVSDDVRGESSETEKRMLLFRLSNASARIREETDLIRRTGFTDQASRLLRILGEAVEEQQVALTRSTAKLARDNK